MTGRSDSRTHRTRAARWLLAACLCACAAASFHASAQPQRPNVADDLEGRKSQPREADPKPPRETRRGRRAGSSVRRGAASGLLTVTFVTGAAGVDIHLQTGAGGAQWLGQTGADGKFVWRLPRGLHTVALSRAGSTLARQQVDVQPGRTTFNFGAGARGAAGVPVAAPAVSAAEVFGRFLNPKQTDSVTLAHWQAAQAQTAAAYSLNPHDPLNAAQAHFAEGQVAYLRGDYPSALNSFNSAALILPNSALAFYGLGNAYLATNQSVKAEQAYREAARLNPTLAMAYRGLGDALVKQGKEKEALDQYARARGLGYTSPALEEATARGLLRLRRWEQAANLYLEIARARPSAEAFVGLGDSYAGLKKREDALAAYRRATQLDAKSALAYYKAGEMSFNLRDYAAANEALERALALPADPAGGPFDRARARQLADKAAEKSGQRKRN